LTIAADSVTGNKTTLTPKYMQNPEKYKLLEDGTNDI